MPSVAFLFLSALINAEGIRVADSFRINPHAPKKVTLSSSTPSTSLLSFGIQSVMKLPWPSTLRSANNVSSLLDRGSKPSASDTALFTEEQCEEMKAKWSAKMKLPDFADFMTLCKGYNKARLEDTGISLQAVPDVVTNKDGTSLKGEDGTWSMYTNDALKDSFIRLLTEGKIKGTDNGSGEPRTYAEVIQALLDNGIRVYLFGGVVRDMARGLEANDVDIGFSGTANEVAEAIRNTLIKPGSNWGKLTYVPGIGEALWSTPGSDYFQFGNEDTQIEGKPDNYNVLTSHLATDLSMNTLAFDVGCLRDAQCYLVDKLGVGLEHALSGVMDVPMPGGADHYDEIDFDDWMSWNCIDNPVSPCRGLLRFLKFMGRGWQPTAKFRDLIVPALRVLFKAADYNVDKTTFWSTFHAEREKLGLPLNFVLRRASPPTFALMATSNFKPLAPDLHAGMAGYFHHIAKPTRLASLKEAVKMADMFQEEILKTSSPGICEQLAAWCQPVEEIFPAIVSFSVARFSGVYGNGRGSYTNHPCAEQSTKDSVRQTGWYSWSSYNKMWQPSSKSQKLSNALSTAEAGACPTDIEDVEPITWATISKNVFLCYVPSGPTDQVLRKLITCK